LGWCKLFNILEMGKKKIDEFDNNPTPSGSSLFLVEESDGIYYNISKDQLAALIGSSQSLQDVITIDATVDGVVFQSLDGNTKIEISDSEINFTGLIKKNNEEVAVIEQAASGAINAEFSKTYILNGNATFTDPSAIQGRYYKVITSNLGVATIGGTGYGYTNGSVVYRVYTYAGWKTFMVTSKQVNDLLYSPIALRAYVSGGNFTTTSLTLVNITGLSVALEANSVYEIDIKLTYESSSNAGLNTGVDFSAAGATIEAGEYGSRDGEVGKVARISAFNTSGAATAFIRLSSTIQTHEIKGIVRTGANAGNLTAQILKTTSGTATVYVDSYIRANKV